MKRPGLKGFVYEPSEDSFLLLDAARYARGDVLELFAGSGLVGFAAAEIADSVTFADINHAAVEAINHRIADNGMRSCRAVVSDLFNALAGKHFDVIYMNPPYLPGKKHKGMIDTALVGGKEGYELTIKALRHAREHLNEGGEIYLIISTVYDVRKVYKELESIKFKFEVLKTRKFFFEELILIKIYEERRNRNSRQADDSSSADRLRSTDTPR